MNDDLLSSLRENAGAQVVATPPGAFIPVDDDRKIWIVEKGQLELFLVHISGAGPKHFVTTIEAEQVLFGLSTKGFQVKIVARAAPSTRVLATSHQRLRPLTRSRTHLTGIMELIDAWIVQLSTALCPSTPPTDPILLSEGFMITPDGAPRSLAVSQGVAWTRIMRGRACFLGNVQVPVIENGACFPVTARGWLSADPGTSVTVFGSDAPPDIDLVLGGLEQFHAGALETGILKLQASDEKEATRLKSRNTSDEHEARRLKTRNKLDEALVHSSLMQMVTPLMRSGEEESYQTSFTSDPLRTVCGIVFRRVGVELPAHSGPMTGVAAEHAIRQMAESANVRLRNVHYEEGWWRQANGYFIAFRAADERPVAILPSIRGGLKIVDPVENRSTAVNSKTASTLSAKGFQVYRPLPEVRMKPGQLLEFSMKGCEKELATIVMMGVAVGLLGTIPPIFMGRLVDSVIPGAQHSELLQLTLIVVAVAISTALFMTTRIYALLRLEGKIDGPLQAAVWDRLLRLPSTFFRNFQAGDLADRSIGISEVRRILTGSTLSSILSGLFSTFNLALLFYFSPLLALVACGLVGVAVAVSVTSVLIQIRIQRRLSTLRGQLSGIVLQLISGITKFRVCGAERRAFAIWAKLYAKQKEFAVKSRRVSNVLTIFNAAFPLICLGMLFLCASQLLPNGVEGTVASLKTGLTTGAFIAFLAAFTQFMGATLELSYTLVSVLHVVPLIERVSPILSTMPELDGVQTHPGQMSGHIEVSRLAFRYKPDTPPVLRDVSFAVNPGQSIALIGTSGCGKSTLLRILLGFEQPGAGAVYYDGQDLAGLDILAVRRQIGVVLQNGRLMDGSILTNIIGSSSLTIEDAWEAARLAGIADEIRQMRDGMHTVLAEGGAALSGGQRQRIMIARAIVKKPRILFFDEGTSALDNRTQAVVTESLAQLKATRIIVAHRLSTVMDADQLIVLEKGTVVEAGKYDELMARQGAFHQIAARQIM